MRTTVITLGDHSNNLCPSNQPTTVSNLRLFDQEAPFFLFKNGKSATLNDPGLIIKLAHESRQAVLLGDVISNEKKKTQKLDESEYHNVEVR